LRGGAGVRRAGAAEPSLTLACLGQGDYVALAATTRRRISLCAPIPLHIIQIQLFRGAYRVRNPRGGPRRLRLVVSAPRLWLPQRFPSGLHRMKAVLRTACRGGGPRASKRAVNTSSRRCCGYRLGCLQLPQHDLGGTLAPPHGKRVELRHYSRPSRRSRLSSGPAVEVSYLSRLLARAGLAAGEPDAVAHAGGGRRWRRRSAFGIGV
jgi:hypothetical protein